VLVARPNEIQYGHLGLEIGMALLRAREQGADVYLVQPRTPFGAGFFELESPDVRVLHPSRMARNVIEACMPWLRFQARVARWREDLHEQVDRELIHEMSRYIEAPGIPPPIRERLRRTRRRFRTSLDRVERKRHLRAIYYERKLLRAPLPVRLRPSAEREAAAQAQAHGIPPEARIVCIHARESGYKRGREIQDTKPELGRVDEARNARIESYLEAADYLTARGFTVVRLGDPTMTPVQHPGVVDLATSPARTHLLETYCLLRCAFIIAGESAYVNVVYLTNTPILLVNVTEPISAYPIRAPGLLLPKGVVDKRDGRRLRNSDLLTLDYQRQIRDIRRYLYVDNPPGHIRQATEEMLDWVDGRWSESDGQRRYHSTIMAAAERLGHRPYVRKWGLHEGFLGDGRIARVALDETTNDADAQGRPAGDRVHA
jgi:putative glycosyltransferase (TIGR04372 family)